MYATFSITAYIAIILFCLLGFFVTQKYTMSMRAKQAYNVQKEMLDGNEVYKLEFPSCFVYVKRDFPLYFLTMSQKTLLIQKKNEEVFFLDIEISKKHRFPVSKVVYKSPR